MTLLRVEMRRALHRRAVRVLIAVAGLGCLLAGVVAFAGSAGKSLAELRYTEDGSPAIMTDWWISDSADGYLAFAMFFLILGAYFGGATVAGGEWRAGTVTTTLTWEPRRLRLLTARLASTATLSFVISLGLQVLFLAAFLPAVFANGTTNGVDGAFWAGLVVAMIRISFVASASAVLAAGLATAARNTAFAIIAAFAWIAVGESLIRGLKPSLSRWLWGENVGTVLIWDQMPDADFARGPLLALFTLAVYFAAILAVGCISFSRRDIAATT